MAFSGEVIRVSFILYILCISLYFVSGFLVGGGSVLVISVVRLVFVALIWVVLEIFISVSCGMSYAFQSFLFRGLLAFTIMRDTDHLFCFRVAHGYVYAIVCPRFAIKYQYRVLHGWFYVCHIQFCWLEFGFHTVPPR